MTSRNIRTTVDAFQSMAKGVKFPPFHGHLYYQYVITSSVKEFGKLARLDEIRGKVLQSKGIYI